MEADAHSKINSGLKLLSLYLKRIAHSEKDCVQLNEDSINKIKSLKGLIKSQSQIDPNLINKKSNSDIAAMLSEFNAAGAASFNTTYPAGLPTETCGTGPESVNIDGYNIPVFSWGGKRHLTNAADISDALFAITGLAFDSGVENDGITGVCANHFGTVLQDAYKWNHLDANNQVLGLSNLFETDPKTVFKNHAHRLNHMGL